MLPVSKHNLTEIAWAAGFFDGEGNTHCALMKGGRKEALRDSARLFAAEQARLARIKIVATKTTAIENRNNGGGTEHERNHD